MKIAQHFGEAYMGTQRGGEASMTQWINRQWAETRTWGQIGTIATFAYVILALAYSAIFPR